MKVTKDYLKKLIKEEIAAMDEEASKKETGHPGTPTAPDNLNALQRYYDNLNTSAEAAARAADKDGRTDDARRERKTARIAKAMSDKIAITIPARYKYEENLEKFKEYLEGLKDEGDSYAEQALKDIVAADDLLKQRANASTPSAPLTGDATAPPEEDKV